MYNAGVYILPPESGRNFHENWLRNGKFSINFQIFIIFSPFLTNFHDFYSNSVFWDLLGGKFEEKWKNGTTVHVQFKLE